MSDYPGRTRPPSSAQGEVKFRPEGTARDQARKQCSRNGEPLMMSPLDIPMKPPASTEAQNDAACMMDDKTGSLTDGIVAEKGSK